MKDRDFKTRERWHKKEQERFERIEEKAAKEAVKEKEKWLKECDTDIYNPDKDRENEEAKKRLLKELVGDSNGSV